MSDRRQVWVTLAALLGRLETAVSERATSPSPNLNGVQKEIRRLGKTQFKANTLAESQAAKWEEMAAALQAAQTQNEELLAMVRNGEETAVSQQLLTAILPAMDSLEDAINSGQRYLTRRDKAARLHDLTVEQVARLVSPADRAVLSGWLDGLRLVRERLLAVLAAGGVAPIPTVGHPFDPFRHRAVGTMPAGNNPPNTIASEERCGYETAKGILRYAEVIVYK